MELILGSLTTAMHRSAAPGCHPNHRLAEADGAWGEKTSYSKKSLGIIRASFLIDTAGKIVAAWYGVKPEDTVPKAQKALSGG